MPGAVIGRQAGDLLAVEIDRAGVGLGQADDGFESGGFADAVAAHEADQAAVRARPD